MPHLELETHRWNLPWLATASTVMASCGPLVSPGQTDTDAMTDSSPQPTGADTMGAPCRDASECGADFDCIDGVCVPSECNSGGCCYGDCCYGECYEVECSSHGDCGPYSLCEGVGSEAYCVDTLPLGECGDGLVITALPLPAPSGSLISLAYVEVDGDPGQELVVGRFGGADLLPGPDEMFAALPVPRGSSIRATTGGDFDGDGDGDLVMATDAGQLLMLVNEGAGTFALSQQIDVDPPVSWLDTVQWNGDGIADVVAYSGSAALVQMIEPAGMFGPSSVLPATFFHPPAVTDYGDDAHGDLVAQSLDDGIQVYLGGVSGDVVADAVLSGRQNANRRVFAGPILGTPPWEVMGKSSFDEGWQLLELWSGGSEGPQLYSVPGSAWYELTGDVDGNGTADLVMGDGAMLQYVRTESTGGSPSFACYVPYEFDGSVGNLGIGDLDGNGRADVTLSTQENDLWVLLSQ